MCGTEHVLKVFRWASFINERSCEILTLLVVTLYTANLAGFRAVSARWFGVSNVTLAQIEVNASCQEVSVAGGRSVTIYKGQAMNGCTV